MSNFVYMKKQQDSFKEPLIILNVELSDNQVAALSIYDDSDPYKLATQFIKDYNLNNQYVDPIAQNIIKQMHLYDQMKQQQSPIEAKKQKNKILSDDKSDTDKEFDLYEKIYQNQKKLSKKPQQDFSSKKLSKQSDNRINPIIKKNEKTAKKIFPPQKLSNPGVNNLKQKSPNRFATPIKFQKPQVKVSILEEEPTDNVSFSQEKSFNEYYSSQRPLYTQDEIENAFNDFLGSEQQEYKQKTILKLFRILDENDTGYIDTSAIPYERFNSQLIVQLRRFFQKLGSRRLSYKQFVTQIEKNEQLIKSASDFFGIKNDF